MINIRRQQVTKIVISVLLFSTLSTTSASEITRHTFHSPLLKRDYAFTIYLPEDYMQSSRQYSVLYLLHGSFGNENAWPEYGKIQSVMDTLIESKKIPPAIVVMPGSLSWWIDGHNEAAESAFFKELIPHIEKEFRVISERKGRVLGGLSAGGYGTINFALKYPQMFAAGAALSPASYSGLPPLGSSSYRHPAYLNKQGKFDANLWNANNYLAFIDSYKSQPLVVPLYINSGDHDGLDIAYHSAVLFQSLFKHQPNSVEYRVVDGGHEWKVWTETLPDALEFAFSHASVPR